MRNNTQLVIHIIITMWKLSLITNQEKENAASKKSIL